MFWKPLSFLETSPREENDNSGDNKFWKSYSTTMFWLIHGSFSEDMEASNIDWRIKFAYLVFYILAIYIIQEQLPYWVSKLLDFVWIEMTRLWKWKREDRHNFGLEVSTIENLMLVFDSFYAKQQENPLMNYIDRLQHVLSIFIILFSILIYQQFASGVIILWKIQVFTYAPLVIFFFMNSISYSLGSSRVFGAIWWRILSDKSNICVPCLKWKLFLFDKILANVAVKVVRENLFSYSEFAKSNLLFGFDWSNKNRKCDLWQFKYWDLVLGVKPLYFISKHW